MTLLSTLQSKIYVATYMTRACENGLSVYSYNM